MKKTNEVLLWMLQVLVAAAFLGAGLAKLSGQTRMIEEFDHIGAGQWLRYFIGGVEVFSAILVLIPKFTHFGAVMLVATMFGALCAHFFVIGGNPLPAGVLLALAVVIAWGRKNPVQTSVRTTQLSHNQPTN